PLPHGRIHDDHPSLCCLPLPRFASPFSLQARSESIVDSRTRSKRKPGAACCSRLARQSRKTSFPDNLRNPALIDAAIDKTVRFEAPINSDYGVRGSGGDDLGLVDYTRLSFYLFGYRLRFLQLAFICAFRSRPELLAILIVVSAAHVFLFTSSILDRHNLSSISDPRFLSVLAVIPCLHLACALLAPLSFFSFSGQCKSQRKVSTWA